MAFNGILMGFNGKSINTNGDSTMLGYSPTKRGRNEQKRGLKRGQPDNQTCNLCKMNGSTCFTKNGHWISPIGENTKNNTWSQASWIFLPAHGWPKKDVVRRDVTKIFWV